MCNLQEFAWTLVFFYSACVLFVADLNVVLLQIFHVVQHPSSVLCILQQGSHIKHIVQVGLDLNLQLLALCQLESLINTHIDTQVCSSQVH